MIDKQKQIAEMAGHVCTPCEYDYSGTCDLHRLPEQCHTATRVAEALYDAGYRKQVEGEWLPTDRTAYDRDGTPFRTYVCSSCGLETDSYYRDARDISKFCWECGAKMKGSGE